MSAADSAFLLSVEGAEDVSFQVLSFRAKESICAPPEIEVAALSEEKGIPPGDMVGREAVLCIRRGGEHYLRGTVERYEEEPREDGRHRYVLRIGSRLGGGRLRSRCRVFVDRDAPSILSQLLEEAGCSPDSWRLDVACDHPGRELRVQYNESDFDFFHRVAAAAGIWYFEDSGPSRTVLVVGDDNSRFPEASTGGALAFRPGAGMLEEDVLSMHSLRRIRAAAREAVRIRGYDYERPGASPEGGVGSGAGWERHETSWTSDRDLAEHARRVRESDNLERERIECATRNPALRPGRRFRIAPSCGGGFSGEYLAVEVRHEGSQEGSVMGTGSVSVYENRVVAQRASFPFRASPEEGRPRFPGILVAKVDGPEGDPHAHIDDSGRYRVRFPFDRDGGRPCEGSPPVRLAQPGAGPGAGIHLPLKAGTDLVLAFEDGDLDRPVALGALPGPAHRSPVVARNRSQSILRAPSGGQVLLEEKEGARRVQANSAGGRKWVLDDSDGAEGIFLESARKHRLKLDDAGDSLELSASDGAHSLAIAAADGTVVLRTGSGHVLSLDDANKRIFLRSAGGAALEIDDGEGTLVLRDADGSHAIRIEAGGRISLESSGDLEIAAKGKLSISGREVSVRSEGGGLEVGAGGELRLHGASTKIGADRSLEIEAGQQGSVRAGADLKLEGAMNLESKAGAANRMTGTTAAVESSALCTVKGAMVMIN